MFLDGRCPLAVEAGIEQSELPSRRRPACHDPVLAAVKVEVFPLIPDVVKGCHPGTDMEVHVCQEAVLSDVEANADRARIAVANLKVHVAHGGIECARISVYDAGRRRDSSGKGNW